jgi:biopolymer transport protein ExbB
MEQYGMTPSANNLTGAAVTPLEQLVDMGGPVMWVLLGLAVVGLVAFFYLVIAGAFFAPRLTPRLRKLVDQWQQQPTDRCADQVGHVERLALPS